MAHPAKRRPINPIRWWWVVLAGVMTGLATWGATWWLLTVAGHSADLRVQAIQSGLTVAAGTGGAAALLLAARRQWLQERDQSHREDTDAASQLHQQRLAEITEQDAIERRITDLYTKAVDQLGSDKAPVRLGGLYALERLAQDNLSQRQTIVNVICAYLRMPYDPPVSDDVGAANNSAREELQVRLTAQRILALHLKAYREAGKPFWDGMTIDLTGATLVDLDLSGCTITEIECRGAIFVDGVHFGGATFIGKASFADADFSTDDSSADPVVDFEAAVFRCDADFAGASFRAMTRFWETKFEKEAFFIAAHFSDLAGFNRANFKGSAAFWVTEFKAGAVYDHVKFESGASFEDAKFTQAKQHAAASFARTVSLFHPGRSDLVAV